MDYTNTDAYELERRVQQALCELHWVCSWKKRRPPSIIWPRVTQLGRIVWRILFQPRWSAGRWKSTT